MSEPTDAQIEAAAKAIYPILQDILNGRPLVEKLVGSSMPEFILARAALAAAQAAGAQPSVDLFEFGRRINDKAWAAAIDAAAAFVDGWDYTDDPAIARFAPGLAKGIRALSPPASAETEREVMQHSAESSANKTSPLSASAPAGAPSEQVRWQRVNDEPFDVNDSLAILGHNMDADTVALGRQIAKVLDEEQIKPPLRPQAWEKIHKAISAALAQARDNCK